jgi:ABC-type nitrate/sulfonate/bicarbonate transport system ATPase subunit
MDLLIAEKRFAGGPPHPARILFRNFALTIPTGQVCVISGPSGVGKSTLLAIIAGTDRDFSGVLRDRPDPVGMMFQAPRLLPWLTALRNVELAIPGREEEARGWFGALGLDGAELVHPERLSLGMARRVALARALAIRPALLLLDEPFAGLDRATIDRVCNVLARNRTTTLIVSHDLDAVASLADRIIILEGSPAEIVSDHWSRLATRDAAVPNDASAAS